jgi:hypothetical protein
MPAQSTCGADLVRAFPAGKEHKIAPRNGLTRARQALDSSDQVDIQTANHEDLLRLHGITHLLLCVLCFSAFSA